MLSSLARLLATRAVAFRVAFVHAQPLPVRHCSEDSGRMFELAGLKPQRPRSATSLSGASLCEAFVINNGKPVRRGVRNADLEHEFRLQCLTRMRFCLTPEFDYVRVTILQSASWPPPYIETSTQGGTPWARMRPSLCVMEFPAMEDHSRFAAEFAQMPLWRSLPAVLKYAGVCSAQAAPRPDIGSTRHGRATGISTPSPVRA